VTELPITNTGVLVYSSGDSLMKIDGVRIDGFPVFETTESFGISIKDGDDLEKVWPTVVSLIGTMYSLVEHKHGRAPAVIAIAVDIPIGLIEDLEQLIGDPDVVTIYAYGLDRDEIGTCACDCIYPSTTEEDEDYE